MQATAPLASSPPPVSLAWRHAPRREPRAGVLGLSPADSCTGAIEMSTHPATTPVPVPRIDLPEAAAVANPDVPEVHVNAPEPIRREPKAHIQERQRVMDRCES